MHILDATGQRTMITEKWAEALISFWCYPMDWTFSRKSRLLRSVSIFPAFLLMLVLLFLCAIPFLLCAGPFNMIETAWRGIK